MVKEYSFKRKCKICGNSFYGKVKTLKSEYNFCDACKEIKTVHECKCGCHELISIRRKFKHGHNAKGMKISAKAMQAFSVNHKVGIKKSEKWRKSNALGKIKHKTIKVNCPYCGKEYLNPTREKNSIPKVLICPECKKLTRLCKCGCSSKIPLTNKFKHGHNEKGVKRKWLSKSLKIDNPMHRPEVIEKRVKLGFCYVSAPEKKAKKILSSNGIYYEDGKVFWEMEHKYPCDIFIPSKNIVIEIDGKYWHNYPHGNERDHLRNKELAALGVKVFRVWDDENLSNNMLKIVNFIKGK